ncbi:MAG TPA: condensation domain-containing protein [Candidatus Kapabacteria bacterium]|nr:condensation domain-containing protein [Candidatus Kapabacteria bacterium]
MTKHAAITERIAALSPEQQELLRRRLRERGLSMPGDVSTAAAGMADAPLSHEQEGLWFLEQLDPGNVAYNEAIALRMHGPLDVPALERGLNTILGRHAGLRTTIIAGADGPQQHVNAFAPFSLPVLPIDSSQAQRDQVAAAVAEPFCLDAGPLWRVRLFRAASDEHLLLVVIHHIIADGWSLGIFVREISELYSADVAGREVRLPALPVDYCSYAYRQRQRSSRESVAEHLRFWKEQLRGLPPDPTGVPSRIDRPGECARRSFILSDEIAHRVRMLAREEGVSLFTVLLSAFDVMLMIDSGLDDIVVGTDVANRPSAELEGVIGLFVNQAVLRADLSGDPGFRTLIARVHSGVLDAFAHVDLPFSRMVAELQELRRAPRSPLFTAKFVMQNAPLPSIGLEGLATELVDIGSGAAKFDLLIDMWDVRTSLHGTVTCSANGRSTGSIDRIIMNYEYLLSVLVGYPDLPISRAGAELERHRESYLERERAARRAARREGLQSFIRRPPESRKDSLEVGDE